MGLSVDIQKTHDAQPTHQYDVVVMGGGPYGLSSSVHLRAQGLKVATFGKSNYFWRNHMPEGMLLRSYWWATSLSDPEGKFSFSRYFEETGKQPAEPLPMETFIDYGLWFQQNALPDLDETYIKHIERKDDLFQVTLEDGRVVQSKAVVMAPGLHYYMYIPPEYRHMPSSLVSHSAEHAQFGKFKGKTVAVIGGGQGALESAALLYEQGAKVHSIMRTPLHWIPVSNSRVPAWIRTIRAPQAGMGNGWLNWILEKYPYMLQSMPRNAIDYMFETKHGPAGSPWLKPRLFNKVTIHEGVNVNKIEAIGDLAKLSLSSGETLEVDHVILGTGYKTDVQRLSMLDQSLRDTIQTYKGSPVLNTCFESSVPGLYFLGYTSARSFGPFYRFVVGVGAAARRVTSAISQQAVRSR